MIKTVDRIAGNGNAIGFVNTQYFREAAIYFNKYKRYDDGVPGTLYHRQYWERELDRIAHGYEVGGTRVTGLHYGYMNYGRIIAVEEIDGTKHKLYGEVSKTRDKHAKKVGQRVEKFADFWDVDWMYFTALDIAKYGISLEDYKKLPINLNVTEDSLGGGLHFVWLKPRGVGASWKGAWIATRNFTTVRQSKTYMLASDKTFLNEDGIFNKFLLQKDWLIDNALGLGKRSEFKEDKANMNVRASIKVNGFERGFMSEVIGVSLNDDYQKARGKRGQDILYEELGKFPNAHKAWQINRQSTEQLNTTFATQIGFGTGGTEGSDFESVRLMIYDPKTYGCICFDNVYDEGMEGSKCGFFTPAYFDIGLVDANGNSLKEQTKIIQQIERDTLRDAKDPNALPMYKAEKPWDIQEAILETGKNIFISDGLVKHKKYVEASRIDKTMRTVGEFVRDGFDLKFKPNPDLKPIDKFPHDKDDTEGAIVVYNLPYKKSGTIPKDLYKICVDAYRHDATTGDSVGAIYVIEQMNNFTPTKGDLIVASYVGRPEEQETFNERLFELAEFYGAEIAFENDEPGDIIGFAKRHKKLNYLAEEFQLAYDETMKTSEGSRRKYGMHMGSGKENLRKKQGDIFIKRWLYTQRGIRLNSFGILEPVYNYHTIYDLGLLEEFIQYLLDANRDRVSSIRVGIYHQQELLYNEIVPNNPANRPKDDFFERELYVNN